VHLLPPVRELRHDGEAQTRRLLCLLLLRLGALSAGADGRGLLRFREHQVIDCDSDRHLPRALPHRDWASGWRGLMLWGVPVSILLAASWLPEHGLGALPPGRNGWNMLGLILLVGSIVLCCGSE
jgi:hypothetical protein